MSGNFTLSDPILGTIDIEEKFVTDAWLVDQFVGGTLFTWGINDVGQLGNGTTSYYSSPIQIGSLNNWKQVSAGNQTSSAIKTDGTLWTWGDGQSGRLGNGTTLKYSSPVQIGALTTWKQLAIGSSPQAAIKTDSTLWVWGQGANGALGNGNTVDYSSPIQVGSMGIWKQIAISGSSASAIKTDGTLWAWGDNSYGQLGNGTTTSYSSPIQIGSLNNWKLATSVDRTAIFLKTDGTLWSCGYNRFGVLGNGTVVYYSSPVQIGALTNWQSISTSLGQNGTAFAIQNDGTLWGWGYNIYGSLPLPSGGNDKYSSPIQIGSLTTWKQVSSGAQFSTALRTDGTLWAWGRNYRGQLGNGVQGTDYTSPIQIGLLTNWKQVSSGSEFAAGITYKDLG